MMHSYAGIGSRDISPEEATSITKIANIMHEKGYVLYSGHADGSDYTFECGCNNLGISFLPWETFNSNLDKNTQQIVCHNKESVQSIYTFHPAPTKLSVAGLKLMSRNYFQVNGIGYLPKVSFVICCATPKRDGVSGGTGQAIRIANHLDIPIINIRSKNWQYQINLIDSVARPELSEIENIIAELKNQKE